MNRQGVFVNILRLLLLTSMVFILFGCSNKQVVETKIITRTETVEVKVPVKIDIPEIECEFSGEGTVPMTKMLECIILQKKVIDEITERNNQWQ